MSQKYRKQGHSSNSPGVTYLPGIGDILAYGSTVPTTGTKGYAPNCLFMKNSYVAGTSWYINTGTYSSCLFVAFDAGLGNSTVTGTLTVTGATTLGGAITINNAAISVAAQATTITIKANTAAALVVSDATTSVVSVDSRNTLKNVHSVTITGFPVTVATEGAAHLNSSLNLAAKTITYTGTTTTTSSFGAMLNVGVPTFTDASVATLSAASAVHINAVAAAGGSLTITASYMISTSVSDCFLTNAGVWTDHACFEDGKEAVLAASGRAVPDMIDRLVPKQWKYKKEMHGDDFGRDRVGIVYDDLPDELRAPGHKKAVSAGLLSSFALAGLKYLKAENDALRSRLEALEAKVA